MYQGLALCERQSPQKLVKEEMQSCLSIYISIYDLYDITPPAIFLPRRACTGVDNPLWQFLLILRGGLGHNPAGMYKKRGLKMGRCRLNAC
jgi:hypothetical protein